MTVRGCDQPLPLWAPLGHQDKGAKAKVDREPSLLYPQWILSGQLILSVPAGQPAGYAQPLKSYFDCGLIWYEVFMRDCVTSGLLSFDTRMVSN